MFKFDDGQIVEFERLLLATPKAFRFAERNTINDMAFEAQRQGKENARNQMTLRNKWTEGSIKVERARKLTDPAITGSEQSYMRDQEFGGTNTKAGGIGVPIATTYSSGETGRTRKKLPRARNTLRRVRLGKGKLQGMTTKQRTLVAVRVAVETGRRFIYLDKGVRKGIYRVEGGRAGGRSRGWPKGAKLRMVYDLSRPSTPIPRNPWLRPATDTAVSKGRQYWGVRLEQQLRLLRAWRS